MKKFIVFISITFILSSCTSSLEKKLNKGDFNQVKQEINSNETYSKMMKNYLIDNLEMQIGLVELGNKMQLPNSGEIKVPSFKQQINELITDFDSIRKSKIKIKENNEMLENFVTLKNANTVSIDKYNGYLSMTLDFNNQFNKEILYIILNYKYINKYDSEFFDKKSKLTDEVAGKFTGEVEISTKEEYNNVADFMYTKVPVRAKKTLIDELGEEKANDKVKKDFLMEGLKVSVLSVVFKDKSEVTFQNADWEYLDEETVDEETADKEIVDEEIVDEETADEVSSEKPIMKKNDKQEKIKAQINNSDNQRKNTAKIIIGSFGTESNAEKLKKSLLNEGFENIDISEVGNVNRVSILVSGSKEDAQEILKKVKVNHKSAWISYN